MYSLVEKAREFAIERHGNQMHGDRPYVAHLDDVAAVLRDFNYTTFYWQIGGILHDVIEDTDTTREEVEHMFTKPIADLVWTVSGFGTREQQQEEIKQKLIKNPSAAPLKLADRIANVERSIVEGNKFPKHFKKYYAAQNDFATYIKPHVDPIMWERLETAMMYGELQGWHL
jgi:(p)ppGpp synthase/HD superfamily hydrolase